MTYLIGILILSGIFIGLSLAASLILTFLIITFEYGDENGDGNN